MKPTNSTTSKPRALVILAEGAEEMEATIVVDVLRRAEIDVTLAGLDGGDPIKCSRGVRIVPDKALSDIAHIARGEGGSARDAGDAKDVFDAIVLPGGKGGADRLAASSVVGDLLRAQAEAGRVVAAICAAPIALRSHKVFAGKRMTCHPSVNEVVSAHGELVEEPVVEDGQLLTSRGPGTAFLFALALVERLRGAEVAAKVKAPMMLTP
jgi:DJ-1 family protein